MSLVVLEIQTPQNFACTVTENRNSFQGRNNVEKVFLRWRTEC